MCIKDIFSVAPGTKMRSPGTLVFCAVKIACKEIKIPLSNTMHTEDNV